MQDGNAHGRVVVVVSAFRLHTMAFGYNLLDLLRF